MNRREVLGSVGAVSLLPAFDVLAAVPSLRGSSAFEAALQIGPAHSGAGNHRWAEVLGGEITGVLLRGRVQSGRMDWHADPASGAVAVATSMKVLRADGMSIELHDRTVHSDADVDGLSMLPGLPTAPRLFDAAGVLVVVPALAGRLDATQFSSGRVQLRAYRL